MAVSVFDIFRIGIGPSSSHTVGPMRAALRFAEHLERCGLLSQAVGLRVHLYGSLALTGKGHGTDKAVLLGLEGENPEDVDPREADVRLERVKATSTLRVLGSTPLRLCPERDLLFHQSESLPLHPNGLAFEALDSNEAVVESKTYYSVGGGFVVDAEAAGSGRLKDDDTSLPCPFHSGEELLEQCRKMSLPISGVILENEKSWRREDVIRQRLLCIWQVMQDCVRRGCETKGTLPGGLDLKRRAPGLHRELTTRPETALRDPLTILDWVDLYALAVNEENAAGGRVVTAPTNGAAGVIPAVLHYCDRLRGGVGDEGIMRFLLCAGAMAILFKENASISGAEVGCQGEVGVACSMAAAGLTEVLGGTPRQVENAAEIGMEHSLGLTCDPIGGLVQIPCIERNAMASVGAINAARIALRGDGRHFVSLDKVISTMRQTGADMQTKYKETSRGGLAVNVSEC